MRIPTEPIGSIPRSPELLQAITTDDHELQKKYEAAIKATLKDFENTGSPVISDGEQTKSSFVTYPLEGLQHLAQEGLIINFEDGHSRQLPVLTKGPFKYGNYEKKYLSFAQQFTGTPVKQAVISASALSLIYPPSGIEGYSQAEFIKDLLN